MSTTASIIDVVGETTVVISLLSKVIGFPDQIIINYKRKSTTGVSFSNWFLGLLAYAIWTLYGVLKHDWVIVWSQTLGIVLSGVVVGQFIWYWHVNNETPKSSYKPAMTNPRSELISLLRGAFSTPVISFLGRRGFTEALAKEGVSLGTSNDGPPHRLTPLFRYLVALDLLMEAEPLLFTATDLGKKVFLRYGAFCLIDSYNEYFRDLDWVIPESGVSRPHVNRQRNVIGSGQLHARKFFPAVLSHMATIPYEHLTDLGCGDGTFIHEALKARPTLSITAVDLSDQAVAFVDKLHFTKHASVSYSSIVSCAGDISKWSACVPARVGTKQLITMWFLLHEIFNGDLKVLADFFNKLHQRFPGASIAFGELVRLTAEEMAPTHRDSIMPEYVLFHALSGQHLMNEQEFTSLLEQIPYRLVHRQNFDPVPCGSGTISSSMVCILAPLDTHRMISET